MSPNTTVRIDNDLATSQSAVTEGTADFKFPSWIEVHRDVIVPPLSKDGLDDNIDDFCCEISLLVIPFRSVL